MPERSYRHRLVVPDMPRPTDYLPLLEEMATSGLYSNFGPLARRLEARLLETFGKAGERCVTYSSATAGLSASLLATGKNGAVLVPAFTFPASLGAIRAAGMVPIVVDVDPTTWAMEAERLDRALAATGASAVMLVAPFGIARSWTSELEVCRRRGAAVLIDNASGLGGPRLGGAADTDVFEVVSMHATKPFAVGEGGAIFAPKRYEAALRAALNFAIDSHAKPDGPFWGFNGKMSEFHAAVGLAQLARFPSRIGGRQAFAALYRDRFADDARLVCRTEMSLSPWQCFPVLFPTAEIAATVVLRAAALGVEIRRFYRPSLSRWPQTDRFEDCSAAEELAERICVLPVRCLESGSDHREIVDLVFAAIDDAFAECVQRDMA